ncbi:MAG TPA: hypothetical protein PKA10_01475 [Selenomonadales bacterium]|nr:hypothetical protein [Selenomonadales bacterium]
MDFGIEYLYLALGVGILYLVISFLYSMFHPPKSIFQKPTNHVEIRAWKIKP